MDWVEYGPSPNKKEKRGFAEKNDVLDRFVSRLELELDEKDAILKHLEDGRERQKMRISYLIKCLKVSLFFNFCFFMYFLF